MSAPKSLLAAREISAHLCRRSTFESKSLNVSGTPSGIKRLKQLESDCQGCCVRSQSERRKSCDGIFDHDGLQRFNELTYQSPSSDNCKTIKTGGTDEMYHNSVCCNSVRPVRHFRFQGYRDCRSPGQSTRPFQGNKCDSKSPCVGLHGLSFDPTDTHALLCAVNALQSTKDPQRCPPVRTSCSDSPRQSSSCSSSSKSCDSSDSLTAPSTCAPIPCPCGRAQSIPITETEQACSSSSHSTTSSSQENYSSQGMSQRGSKRGSVGVSVGAETSSKVLTCSEQVKTASGEKSGQKKGLTWIDWGWPGTHDPCPFNQRHTVDDSLIRPEPVFCESSCPLIGKLVRCCKIRVRQLREVCWQEEIMATTAVDVKELAASYVFIADMPGLKHTDIKVQVENDNVLKISGERKREDAVQDGEVKYVRVERSAGKFMRKFNLPANANLDAISAACQDGLLTIIVPKTPPPDIYRPRTFDVNVISANLGH